MCDTHTNIPKQTGAELRAEKTNTAIEDAKTLNNSINKIGDVPGTIREKMDSIMNFLNNK